MRFVSDHSTVKAFLGLSQNPTQSKKIFWVKWSLKGNLGKPLTTHVISHTSIWIGFQNWSKRETVYAMFPSSSFIEISKVCQYCGKAGRAHLFSQFELSQTHIAIKHTWHLSPFVQPGVKKLRISMFFVVCFLSKKPWFGVFLVNKMTNITYAIMFDKQWKCFKS